MSWNPFAKKRERILGVDIGTSSIKIVELAQTRAEKIELTNYGEFFSGAESSIQSASVRLSPKTSTDIIKRIIREAGIKETNAAMSMPAFSGFSTVISLPDMTDIELEQAVRFEAKKYIPLPLGEVQFEWMRLESLRGNTRNNMRNNKEAQGHIRILIVAVTNELINKYSKIAKLSGLNLAHLELDSFSLARSLSRDSDLIIDIGSNISTLNIVENGWPVFTRTLDVSGYEFSKLLSSSLGIDFSRAEEFKKKQGISAGADVILPLLDSIFAEGRRIIDEHKRVSVAGKPATVRRAILSGGSANMEGIREYASKSMEMEVVIASPFDGIIYPKELEPTLRDIGPSFSAAVGLALRDYR